MLDDFHSFFYIKLEGKTHFLDTLNIDVGLTEKDFLEAFEKRFRAKNEDFHRIFESDWDAKFWMLKKHMNRSFPCLESDWCVVLESKI